MDLIEGPNLCRLSDITGLGGIDTSQDPHALAMLRILSDRSINPVFPKHRAGVDFARTFGVRVLEPFTRRGIAVEPPYFLEVAAVAFFYWLKHS